MIRGIVCAFAVSVFSMLSWSAAACDSDRYPCAVSLSDFARAPSGPPITVVPLKSQKAAKPRRAPLETVATSPAPVPDSRPAAETTGATSADEDSELNLAAVVQVVSAREINVIDLAADIAALQARVLLAATAPAGDIAQPTAYSEPPRVTATTADRQAQTPVDTLAIAQLVIAFGAAFAVASAIRLFAG